MHQRVFDYFRISELVFNDIVVFNNDFDISTIDNGKISFVYLNQDRIVSILTVIVRVFD